MGAPLAAECESDGIGEMRLWWSLSSTWERQYGVKLGASYLRCSLSERHCASVDQLAFSCCLKPGQYSPVIDFGTGLPEITTTQFTRQPMTHPTTTPVMSQLCDTQF